MNRSDISAAVIAAFLAVSQAALMLPRVPEGSGSGEDGDAATAQRSVREIAEHPEVSKRP